ncbi:DUF5335 domain-containing protein [Microvirga terricola]|uniref:DUF5335 family protein n=1 Tax=Microvirga terricola TaxID=2719797 RepID=A0ABX0VB10_9HYPH|nr:DUF5335 domain-containing protein [Microvirga terricola]NIX76369.1 DUF5335 family protein [Microvirga terricola]
MTVHQLQRGEWSAFCNRVSKGLSGRLAEVQIASPRIGSQIEAEWIPLIGLVYEPKEDTLEIALDGVDHIIQKPQELYADESVAGLANFEIVDGEGTKTIVTLRDPLMLPLHAAS